MPMLFVVIPAIVGIILASHCAIPVVVLCCAIGLSTLGALYARPRGEECGWVFTPWGDRGLDGWMASPTH